MPIEFRHATLDNGLNVIAEQDPDAHTAAVGFFVRTGARDEQPDIMGVSHFLEHMMFKGSETRDGEAVDRDFDNLGANHNAFTSNELTAFWAHMLPEHLDTGTEILADIMRPALREQDFETEKNVILEEIAMYEDYPFWALYEQTLEQFYGSSPLGHRVLGTKQTVGDMTHTQMRQYFDQRYSADNTVVALAGNVDFDRMVDRLNQWCGTWPATNPARSHDALDLPADEQFSLESNRINRHYELMLAPGPSAQDDRRYAASILGQILGDADGSRLYWALVDTGLAEDAFAQYEGRDGTGEMFVYFSCPPESADEVERIVLKEIDRLVDSIDEDDLERVRNKVATAATLHGERPAGRMRRLGQLWTYLGEYKPLDEELDRINRVTIDELKSVAAAFPVRPRVTGRLRPEEAADES